MDAKQYFMMSFRTALDKEAGMVRCYLEGAPADGETEPYKEELGSISLVIVNDDQTSFQRWLDLMSSLTNELIEKCGNKVLLVSKNEDN